MSFWWSSSGRGYCHRTCHERCQPCSSAVWDSFLTHQVFLVLKWPVLNRQVTTETQCIPDHSYIWPWFKPTVGQGVGLLWHPCKTIQYCWHTEPHRPRYYAIWEKSYWNNTTNPSFLPFLSFLFIFLHNVMWMWRTTNSPVDLSYLSEWKGGSFSK